MWKGSFYLPSSVILEKNRALNISLAKTKMYLYHPVHTTGDLE